MEEAAVSRTPTPWHHWLVGVLALLWNGYGGYDYWMSNTGGAAYFEKVGMTPAQIDYFNAMPAWMTAVWAVGVWGAVLGSILLLLRSRWAVHVFVVSLAALLVSLVYAYVLSNGAELMGTFGMVMNAVVTAGAVFFIWYSRRAAGRGVLR